ncbi:transmembrane protein 272-like [Symsagittifera roscoffensis]|uniref:transmembrane protein 272-like n=1 Tax=Symsagittifera roscoffensis TaxID=84072 RepID=UPI00307C073E
MERGNSAGYQETTGQHQKLYQQGEGLESQQLGSNKPNPDHLASVSSNWGQMSYQLLDQIHPHSSNLTSNGVAMHSSESTEGRSFHSGSNSHSKHHLSRQPTQAGSLFDGMKEAQETSTNLLDLMNKTVRAIAIGFPCTVVLGGLMVLPIAMIAIGGGNYYKCPASEWLPSWLIITGILLMFFCILLIRIVGKVRQDESGELLEDFDASSYKSSKNFVWVLTALQTVWYCMGNYFVFSIYYPHTEIPQEPPFVYCEEALYNFSLFWIFAVYTAVVITLASMLFIVYLYYRNSQRYMDFEYLPSYQRI